MGEEFVNPIDATPEEVFEAPAEVTPEAPSEPEWQPDYKIKVLDKEYEIDEFVRPIINKENYAKVKELYEKAYGLDFVKQRYQKANEELEAIRPSLQEKQKNDEILGYMGNLIQRKDYQTLFNELRVPDEAIMQIAVEKANLKGMSPEDRQAYENSIAVKQENYALQMQNLKYQQEIQSRQAQERTSNLENYLMSENIKQVAESFDSQAGRPGAFRDEVINKGKYIANTFGKDVTIEDAVNAVVYDRKLYSLPQNQQSNVASVAPTQQKLRPVIPNVRAGNASPAGRTVKSIADLKKLAEELSERND